MGKVKDRDFRLRLFNGSRAMEEKKRFQKFLMEETPLALSEAKEKLWDLVFSTGGSERVSRLLQNMFLWYYENYLRDDRSLKVKFVEKMRIYTRNHDHEEVLDALYENMKLELQLRR